LALLDGVARYPWALLLRDALGLLLSVACAVELTALLWLLL